MGLRIEVRSGWGEGETERLTFDQTRVVVGRRSGSDVQLPHPAVSGHHATVRVDGRRCTIIDERSTNGVRVNGERLVPGRAKALAEGDEVALGGFFLSIEQGAVGGSSTAESTRAVARRLLVAQASEVEGPKLFFINGRRAGESVALAEPPSSIVAGRGAPLDLPDGDASREHAEFLHELAGVRV
ncbi:MAG: FHA domain-containing protein, partial [Myxococcota bacterium]